MIQRSGSWLEVQNDEAASRPPGDPPPFIVTVGRYLSPETRSGVIRLRLR
jgi:hypothetical protein